MTLSVLYSQRDEKWKNRLVPLLKERGLKVLQSAVENIEDGHIPSSLKAIDRVIILITADFLAALPASETVLRHLLQGVTAPQILAVLVKPCPWETHPWLTFQEMIPENREPLMDLSPEQETSKLNAAADHIVSLSAQGFRPSVPFIPEVNQQETSRPQPPKSFEKQTPEMLRAQKRLSGPARVYISYSHVDRAWKDRIVEHLAGVKPLKIMDHELMPIGEDWETAARNNIKGVDIALLLISADYLASDFIMDREAPIIMKSQLDQGTLVIPVIIKPCIWQMVEWLSHIQVFPRDCQPLLLKDTPQQDALLSELATDIEHLLGRFVKDELQDDVDLLKVQVFNALRKVKRKPDVSDQELQLRITEIFNDISDPGPPVRKLK